MSCIVSGYVIESLDNTPVLAERLACVEVIDVARIQALTGQEQPITTCLAHGAHRETRRDYALISKHIIGWVKRVARIEGAGFDVHWPLEIELTPPKQDMFRSLVMPEQFVPLRA